MEKRGIQSSARPGMGWTLQHHPSTEAEQDQELLGNAWTPHGATAAPKAVPISPHFSWDVAMESRQLPRAPPVPARSVLDKGAGGSRGRRVPAQELGFFGRACGSFVSCGSGLALLGLALLGLAQAPPGAEHPLRLLIPEGRFPWLSRRWRRQWQERSPLFPGWVARGRAALSGGTGGVSRGFSRAGAAASSSAPGPAPPPSGRGGCWPRVCAVPAGGAGPRSRSPAGTCPAGFSCGPGAGS